MSRYKLLAWAIVALLAFGAFTHPARARVLASDGLGVLHAAVSKIHIGNSANG
jgi:hypothetical protein